MMNQHHPWLTYSERHMTITLDEEDPTSVIRAMFAICDRCDGAGKHVNPAVDGHGISPDEFNEDPDFADAYFRGHYDVPCEGCDGKRVVMIPDPERNSEEIIALYEQAWGDLYEDRDIRRAEMGYQY